MIFSLLERGSKHMKYMYKWPLFLLLFLVGGAFISSLFRHAYYVPDKPMFDTTSPVNLLLIIGIILVVIIIIFYSRKLRFVNGLCVSFCISITCQLAFILLYPLNPYSDMGTVYQIATEFENGALFTALEKGGYLAIFPNNMYFALFLSLIYMIFPHAIIVGKIINIIFSLIIIYSTARIYKEFFGERYIGGLLVLLSFFPPFILYSNHMYNDIISIAFFTSATLLLILGLRRKSLYNLMFGFSLLIIGDLLRQIGIVFLIAFWITLLTIGNGRFSKKKIYIMIGVSVLGYFITKPFINILLVIFSIIPTDFNEYNMPVYAWFHIAFDFKTLGFQNGGQSFSIFYNLDYNTKLAAQVYQHDIILNFKNNGFLKTLNFLIKKYLWTWTEGTYQMDRYGFGYENSVQYDTYLTKVISNSPRLRNIVTLIMHYYSVVILGFATLGIYLSHKRKYYDSFIFNLIILGTIGFYCLWEIKSRYIFIVFPYLFIYFYYGVISFLGLSNRYSKIIMKNIKNGMSNNATN